MDVCVLGPVAVVHGGRPVTALRRKPRQVLAALALHTGRLVRVDDLIDMVWSGDPPATARKTLQLYISQLRGVGGLDGGDGCEIRTGNGGYALHADAERVDAQRFEILVERAARRLEGDAAGTRALLLEALALWRGRPFEDLGEHGDAQLEAVRLEERRVAARELLIEADLALGRHHDALPVIRELLAEAPFRTRPWQHLLLALHRCGRTAEALDAFREADRSFRDELGIDTPPELRELERRILNDDPALLDPPAPGGPPAPAVPEPRRRWVTVLAACPPTGHGQGGTAAIKRTIAGFGGLVLGAADGAGSTGASHACVVAVFGAPAAHGDDTERAARTAQALRERHLELAAAFDAGETVLVPAEQAPPGEPPQAGGDRHAAPDGDLIAAVAAAAALVAPGAVLAGPAAVRALAPLLVTEPGAGQAGGWVAVRGIKGAHGRPLSATPLLGREPDLALLDGIWQRVREQRRAHVVTVLGPPGIGKSRLSRELGQRVRGGKVLAQRCLPYGDTTYGALAGLVRDLVGLDEATARQETRWKLDDWLSRTLPRQEMARDAHHRLSLLAVLADIVERPAALADTVRQLLAAIAHEPVLLVVEDLHWAHEDLLDLLERVIDGLDDVPLLVLLTARDGLLDRRPGWGGGLGGFTRLDLAPLAPPDAEDMAAHLLPGRAALAARVAGSAGGNPLFTEELAAWVAEGGDLGQVPDTVRTIITARLDRLGPLERRVLGAASVVGERFWPQALEHAGLDGPRVAKSGEVAPAVVEALDGLVRKNLLRREPGGGARATYAFRHDLIREVAYDAIPVEHRRRRHRRVAAFLESAPDVDVPPAVLAHHWRGAGDSERELRYLLQAAREANRGWTRDRAVAFYNRALELLEPDDTRRRAAALERAVALQAWAHVVLDVGHRRPLGGARPAQSGKSSGPMSPPIS